MDLGSTSWFLTSRPATAGYKVRAQTTCLPTVNRTSEVGWSTGEAAHVLASHTANRQCFLTGIANADWYYEAGTFTSASDYVKVWDDGTNWYIGGNGRALGWARCVDVTQHGNQGTWAPTNGGTWVMTQHIDNGTSPLGMQCLLQGVGGEFRTNNFGNGVFINYNNSNQEWSITASAGKTGWVNCVQ